MRSTKKWGQLAIGVVAAVLGLSRPALAADHLDGPAASADPAADITDLFAWMPDASHMALVMDVFPKADANAKFSNAVQYVFHVTSASAFGATSGTQSLNVICTFDASQKISCWAGNSYVTGDASSPNGLTSADGKLKVFAGLRDDPFFFNLAGFNAVKDTVKSAKGSLTFDAAGCPALDANTSDALVTQLHTAPGGGAAQDFFAHLNVLALVVQVDKSLVTGGGPIVGVWGSTNRAQ